MLHIVPLILLFVSVDGASMHEQTCSDKASCGNRVQNDHILLQSRAKLTKTLQGQGRTGPAQQSLVQNDAVMFDVKTAASCSGDHCVVPAGQTWYVRSDLTVRTLTVHGQLKWDTDIDGLEIKTDYLLVESGGLLEVGTAERPMEKRARIYITNGGSEHPKLGVRFVGGLPGSNIQIHGRPLAQTWTQLGHDAPAGSSELFLKHDPEDLGWRVGDEIGIATTSRGRSTKHKIQDIRPSSGMRLKVSDANAGTKTEDAARGIDGSTRTGWESFCGPHCTPDMHWLSVKLPSLSTVKRVRVSFKDSRSSPTFDVELRAGGGSWIRVERVTGAGGGWTEVSLGEGQQADEVRVKADWESMGRRLGEPDWAGVKIEELEVYGWESGKPVPNVLVLDQPVQETHWGGVRDVLGEHVEMAAEVLNLERSVLITGDHGDFYSTLQGLHTLSSGRGSLINVNYARVEYCGQRDRLGRYCLHNHMMGQCPQCTFKGNAVVDSQQVGITIHGTHHTKVSENTIWDARAAGIYTEDGNEMHNLIKGNAIVCSWWEECSVRWLGKVGLFAGIYMIGMTNDVIENHIAGHENGLWSPASSSQRGGGAAVNRVCPQHSPFGIIRGNVIHDCHRFGLYLDNQYPRNLVRDEDGYVTDMSSCDEFTADGRDNGLVPANVVEDELDYHNMFVGQYAMGDIRYDNYTSVNNLRGMYWKTSKNFADGSLYHIQNSRFLNDPADHIGQLQLLGPGGPFTFGIANTRFAGGSVGCGALCAGQHCGSAGAGGPCDTQVLLDNVDFSGVHAGQPRIKFGINAKDPGYVLPIFLAKDNSLGGHRAIVSRHLDGFARVAGCEKLGPEWENGYGCDAPIRRLNIWSRDLGNLNIEGPGYESHPNMAAPVHGMNSGVMVWEHRHSGYGTPVLAGQEYRITGTPLSSEVDLSFEFSDLLLAKHFGGEEKVVVRLGDTRCELWDSGDRRFLGAMGVAKGVNLPVTCGTRAGHSGAPR